MAISRHGNTIIVPQADSGITMTSDMFGHVIGVKVKTAGVVGRSTIYSGTAVDATKVIADTGDVAINSFDGLAGIRQQFRGGMNVQVTGAGAVAYIYID